VKYVDWPKKARTAQNIGKNTSPDSPPRSITRSMNGQTKADWFVETAEHPAHNSTMLPAPLSPPHDNIVVLVYEMLACTSRSGHEAPTQHPPACGNRRRHDSRQERPFCLYPYRLPATKPSSNDYDANWKPGLPWRPRVHRPPSRGR